MTAWTAEELTRFAENDEMRIAGRHADGSLRAPVIVWVVRIGDEVYTRSVNGPAAAWFRGARARHEGHIEVGDLDRDVTFADIDTDDPIQTELDAVYRAKYRRYRGPVARVTDIAARSATVKLVP